MKSIVTLTTVREISIKKAAVPLKMATAGRAYAFFGSGCNSPVAIRQALNRMKAFDREALEAEKTLTNAGRTIAMLEKSCIPEFKGIGQISGIGAAPASTTIKIPLHARFWIYETKSLCHGSSAFFPLIETPLFDIANGWHLKGANYFIRMVLPQAANHETHEVLAGILDHYYFRTEIFGTVQKPVQEIYFRDAQGVYISRSQFQTAVQAIARINGNAANRGLQ